MQINKDVLTMIERELENYPISYTIDRRNSTTCFLDMVSGDDCRARVGFSPGAYGHTILNIRSDIRRKIKSMGCTPIPERRRQARVSSFGEKLMEAADAAAPAALIDIDTTPREEQPTMANAPTNIVAMNGHKHEDESANEPKECKFIKLLQGEIAKATRLLIQNATIDDDTNTVTYATGWSDKRIAEILSAAPGRQGVQEKHVSELRVRNFGLTPAEHDAKRSKAPPTADELAAQIRDLQLRVQALEDAATRP